MDSSIAPAFSRLGDTTAALVLLTRYGWRRLWIEQSKLAMLTAYSGGLLMFSGLFACDKAIGMGPPGTVSALTGLYPQVTLLMTMVSRRIPWYMHAAPSL